MPHPVVRRHPSIANVVKQPQVEVEPKAKHKPAKKPAKKAAK